MIQLRPYDDLSAMAVIQRLDTHDRLEAEIIRGAATTALGLFADWRAMEPLRVASFVVHTTPDRGAHPFALLGLSNSGQAGVAEAALLARDHRAFRRPLAVLAARLRLKFPDWCRERGIHRIEARCWFQHPTASSLLAAIGFAHEADMLGFGRDGSEIYRQFAWHARPTPQPPGD
jgi:hypothetical protein